MSSGLLLYGCSLIYGFSSSTNFNLIAQNINSDSYGEGWIVRVLVSDITDLDDLLDSETYQNLIN